MLSSGKWPQRAKAMMSEESYPIYSGRPKCTTSHFTQLKARVEETLSRNVQVVLARFEEKLVGVSRATCVSMRGESLRGRFHTDSGQFQVKQRQA